MEAHRDFDGVDSLLIIDAEPLEKTKEEFKGIKYSFMSIEELDDNKLKLTFSATLEGGWEQNLYCSIDQSKYDEVSKFLCCGAVVKELFPLKVRFVSESDELTLEADDILFLGMERKDLLKGLTLNGKPYRFATPEDWNAALGFISECSGHDLRQL